MAQKNWTDTKHFWTCKRTRQTYSVVTQKKSILFKILFLEKSQVTLKYNIFALTVKVIINFFFVLLIFCKTNSYFFFTFKQSNVIKIFVQEFYCFKTYIFLQSSLCKNSYGLLNITNFSENWKHIPMQKMGILFQKRFHHILRHFHWMDGW